MQLSVVILLVQALAVAMQQDVAVNQQSNATDIGASIINTWLSQCANIATMSADDGIRTRITAGNLAVGPMFPYQAGLLLLRPASVIKCGGALISTRYVLTAAHCLQSVLFGRVYLGTNEYANGNAVGAVVYDVRPQDFQIYERFSPLSTADDIALIYLSASAVQLTDSVQPIALPLEFMTQSYLENRTVTTSGWGVTGDDIPAAGNNRLNYVDVGVLPQEQCFCKYLPGLVQERSHICTDGAGGRSSCDGDSGGPLSYYYNGVNYLVGLSAFGSAGGCEIGYPSVFTRVASYLDWIAEKTDLQVDITESTTN